MKRDVNLNRLAVFVALVRAGSFTAAAAQLGMTKAMVSQHLLQLERELGVTLLVRSTRRMAMTEAGVAFHADCVQLLEQAQTAIERIGHQRSKPTGTLRLTTSTDYGTAVIAPALAAFQRLHPSLQVDLVIDDQINDLIAERFDLAIRIGWLRDSSLRAMRLGSCRQLVMAAPAYLAEHGAPRRPEDLVTHGWIAMSPLPTPLRWTFTRGSQRRVVRMRQVMQANNAAAIRALVLAGAGVSVLPDYLVRDDIQTGRLQVLLAQYRLPEGGIYAVYPDPQPPAKVRVFIDFLRDHIGAL
ncbi:LysR family transcriptional regulator [Dyella caseinilytica]|uniref:LysR family transcriptional regulator n=1 Tax=Dyella caseinilytica TaxID=1849581 RepID=A0ABX7GQ24_9GAMM|nr:LysR family transcriptional regulator [Dyella caseinilytica]QRN52534.1 LysR family transcriptional regulator [Dyella caseinilytica]GGA06824.1 LysR family transcriptional regulator [Dyella caseinilytica]